MLSIQDGYVEGFDLYSHKDNLKFYKCRWDADAKKWKAPDNTHKLQMYLDKVNEQENERKNALWSQAVEKCGFDSSRIHLAVGRSFMSFRSWRIMAKTFSSPTSRISQ